MDTARIHRLENPVQHYAWGSRTAIPELQQTNDSVRKLADTTRANLPAFIDTNEKARVALADERPLLSAELSRLILEKFDNPLAGIIGGHLLLIGYERPGSPWLDLLNEVVTNLRDLVGFEHPDVEALSLACPDLKLRTELPLRAAPMFERSWRMMLDFRSPAGANYQSDWPPTLRQSARQSAR